MAKIATWHAQAPGWVLLAEPPEVIATVHPKFGQWQWRVLEGGKQVQLGHVKTARRAAMAAVQALKLRGRVVVQDQNVVGEGLHAGC